MRPVWLVCLIFCDSWVAPALAGGFSTEIYAESGTLESEGGTSSTLLIKEKWRRENAPWAFYAGLALDRYAPDARTQTRVAPYLGAEYSLLSSLKLVAEYRRVIETPKSTYSLNDPRLGLVGGYWEEHSLSSRLSLISDSYLEWFWLPRINRGNALTAFTKAGARWRFASATATDLFTEAYARQTDDTNLGRKALELRAGARIAHSFSGWLATVSVFRRYHTFREAPRAEWRAQFTVGGSL